MPRFAILHHETPSGYERPAHWDFMLECGDLLWTWALRELPAVGREVVAEELADHRLAYLDYEGEVSGGRGSVTRWDGGEYEVLGSHDNPGALTPALSQREREKGAIRLVLHGQRVTGEVFLSRLETLDQPAAAGRSPLDAGRSPDGPRYWSFNWKGS